MRIYYYFLLLFFISTFQLNGQNDLLNDTLTNSELYEKLILTVKSNFAPDSRTAIFNIKSDTTIGGKIVLRGKTNLIEAHEAIKNIFTEKQIPFIDKIKLLPDKSLNEKIYGVINNSVSNHRTKPLYASELTTQSLLGTPVNILERNGYWYRVQTPDNYISWVDYGGIQLMTKTEINTWLTARKIVFWKQYGQSYKEPNVNSQTVSDLVVCDVLKYISTNGKFVHVEYPDGRRAYVKKTDCRDHDEWLKNANPTPENIINSAYLFMGLPYLWGGASSKAVDCSGLTKMAYLMNGIVIQRDASQQALYGGSIVSNSEYENIKPADLLFFGEKDPESGKTSVIHVALYLGNFEFIHAARYVTINSFDKNSPVYSQYRVDNFLHAKNYSNNIDSPGIVKITDCEFYKIRK
ncbi:MAG TPA: C40 family peptidase [Paludibacter sp.]|nr:C40 family peptidase [Paludibacter sp.]